MAEEKSVKDSEVLKEATHQKEAAHSKDSKDASHSKVAASQKDSAPSAQEQIVINLGSIGKSASISLWLDTYDDVFSDFDPRPYDQRALSDDFLAEIKKVLRENKAGKVELELQIPATARNESFEPMIKKRVKIYAKHRAAFLEQEQKAVSRRGLSLAGLGVALMIFTTFIIFSMHDSNFFITLLGVIFEPAGWFLFWEGMNRFLFSPESKNIDLDFYTRLSNANIIFKEF